MNKAMAATIMTLGAVATAQAADVSITIENLQPAGGASLTPFWVAAHDGSFDLYDSGASAAGFTGLEQLAELGDTGPVSTAFAASAAGVQGRQTTITSPSTAPPVFAPGDSETVTFDAGDATVNRFFSYGSMVVPSNDLFVANADPMAHEIFNAAGEFTGPVTILIFGRNVIDAGTEANDAANGPAFVVGQMGTDGLVTDAHITPFFDDAGAADYLNSLVGSDTPLYTFSDIFSSDELIGRITIVPTPGAAATLAAFGLLGLRRRR